MANNLSEFYQKIYEISFSEPNQDRYVEYQTGRILVIQSPESAKYILGENLKNYPKRYDWFRQCIGISRFTENNSKWQSLKKISQPFLNGFDRPALLEVIKTIVGEYKERLAIATQDNVLNESLIREMVIDVFCRTFFKFKASDLELNFSGITELLTIALEHAFIAPGSVSGQKERAVYQRIFELRKEMLQEFKRLRDPKYHQSEFMQAILAADQRGELFFEHELVFIFSIGIETTVHSLCWILFTLAKHSKLQSQMRADIAKSLAKKSTYQDYLALQDVVGLIDWVLKKYPPTPCISREAVTNDKIGEFGIQAKEAVIISLLGVLYEENDDVEAYIKQQKYKLKDNLSFGYGQRICGGKNYATVELIYLTVAFLENFDCQLLNDEPITFHWYAQLNRMGGHPIRLQALSH